MDAKTRGRPSGKTTTLIRKRITELLKSGATAVFSTVAKEFNVSRQYTNYIYRLMHPESVNSKHAQKECIACMESKHTSAFGYRKRRCLMCESLGLYRCTKCNEVHNTKASVCTKCTNAYYRAYHKKLSKRKDQKCQK